jgi:hypothetical protein
MQIVVIRFRLCLNPLVFDHGRMARGGQLAMDSLNYHSGSPCPTLLRFAGGPAQKVSSNPLDTPRRTPMSSMEIFGPLTQRGIGHRVGGPSPRPTSVCLPQAHMARGIHELPKVSPGPAMPNPSTPCRQAACGRLLALWIPHAVRACFLPPVRPDVDADVRSCISLDLSFVCEGLVFGFVFGPSLTSQPLVHMKGKDTQADGMGCPKG